MTLHRLVAHAYLHFLNTTLRTSIGLSNLKTAGPEGEQSKREFQKQGWITGVRTALALSVVPSGHLRQSTESGLEPWIRREVKTEYCSLGRARSQDKEPMLPTQKENGD